MIRPATRTRDRRAAAVLAGLAIGFMALSVACGGDDDAPPASTSGAGSALIDSVCAARDAARAGDNDEARRIFFDRVHDALHTLAADVGTDDRAAEARLLEAKQRVEAALAADPSTDLTAHFDGLASATADALEASGAPRPQPCT